MLIFGFVRLVFFFRMQSKEQTIPSPSRGGGRVGMGCEVQPLLASPKGRGLKRIRSEICLSRRRVYFASRFSPLPFGHPKGDDWGSPSFAYFSWRSKKSEWPAE